MRKICLCLKASSFCLYKDKLASGMCQNNKICLLMVILEWMDTRFFLSSLNFREFFTKKLNFHPVFYITKSAMNNFYIVSGLLICITLHRLTQYEYLIV